MNLHVPQTEEARAEAEILTQVQTQIVSPRYGLSIIGCAQDAISGNYLLTRFLSFTRRQAIDLLSSTGVIDFSGLPKKDVVSGREVFSAILPKDFNFVAEPKSDKPEHVEAAVEIKNGQLLKGYLDKAQLGEGSGLLLRTLHQRYGADKMVVIMGQIFRLGIETLLQHGFSSQISDVDLVGGADKNIEKILVDAQKDVEILIGQYEKKELEPLPGRTLLDTLERRILERLNRARNEAGQEVAKVSTGTTGTAIMVDSGARGNLINIAQMSAVVGQQALRGGRIDRGYKNRTLSCFKPGDLSSDARGFIKHSFKSGLDPHELFFMAMTGRDSLMDTALRTPKSGYLYRRLANALQDLKVDYDTTVREASGKIVQFAYGEDGIDVSRSEGGKVNVKKIVDAALR